MTLVMMWNLSNVMLNDGGIQEEFLSDVVAAWHNID